MSITSANPDDLDRYVKQAGQARRTLDDERADLASQQLAVLAGCGDYAVASSVLDRAGQVLHGFALNERFVDTVSDELRKADRNPRTGVATVANAKVSTALQVAGLTQRPPPVTVEPSELLGAPPTSGFVDDPICAASGNFVHIDGDLAFPGWSSLLDLVRVYNSLGVSSSGAFGPGWSSILDVRLQPVDGGVLRMRLADGAVVPFVDVDGVLRTTFIRGLTAECQATGWVVRQGRERSWTFDLDGVLTGMEAVPARVEVQRSDGRVVGLTEHRSGRSLRFEWDENRVAAAHANDGRSVFYRYDERGCLVGVDRPTGAITFDVVDGLIRSFADADGVVLATNVYDDDGRVIEQTSELGRTTVYAYSEHGTTLVSDTIGGPRNAFTHDRRGNVTAIVDGAGRAMRLTYDADGRTTSVTDRTGALRRFEYDERGNLLARIDPDGLTAAWAWDASDRLAVETHRNGAHTTYVYDGEQRYPSAIVGPMGEHFSITLDDETALPRSVVDPDGVTTRFEWDDDGQMTALVDGLGNRSAFAFDESGLLRQTVDGSGLVTEFRSDEAGRVVESIVAGASARRTYSAAGRPLTGIDAGGVSWQAAYGSHGRAVSFADAEGSTVAFEWDPFGNLAALVAPDGARFEQRHDAMNQLIGTRDPQGRELRRSFDAEGRLTELTDAAGRHWARELDVLGRMVRSTDPDGATTTYRYHSDGTVAEVRYPDGTTTTSEVDAGGRIRSIVDAKGGHFSLDYTPAGRLASRRTPSGRVERFEYDAAGRLVAQRRGSVEIRFELDGRGRRTKVTGPGGVADFRYDGGELFEARGPGGSLAAERDAAGRITDLVDGEGGRTTFSWDARGSLAAVVDGAGVRSAFSRDVRGRLATSQVGADPATSYGYDTTGFLESIREPTGTLERMLDPTGLPLGERRPDGSTIARSVDPMGRTTSLEADGETVADFRYDVMGQLIEAVRTSGGVRTSFAWDAAGRLVAVDGPTDGLTADRDDDGVLQGWTQGGAGVRFERDADERIVGLHDDLIGRVIAPSPAEPVRDGAGRIVGRDGSVYRYDAAGRLIEARPSTGARWRFGYSSVGLLESEDGPLGVRRYRRGFLGRLEQIDHGDGTVTTYSYDGAGRRVGADRSDGSSMGWSWDAVGRLVAVERRSPDGTSERIDLDLDAFGRPARLAGRAIVWDDLRTGKPLRIGDERYLHLGGQTRAATPEGEWLGATADPWGSEPSSSADGPHVGFRGELAAWGLVWLGARVYDTSTREFLSPDPLPVVAGRPGASSVYAYGFLDPVNYLDPSGLRPISQADFDQIREREEQGRFGQAWNAIKEDPWGTLALVGVVALGVGILFLGGPLVVGAGILIGAALPAAAGVLLGNFSPRGAAVSGVLGAVPGGNSYKAAMATGGALAVAQEVTTQAMSGDDIDWGMVAIQGVVGSVGGGLTHGVGQRFGRPTESPVRAPSTVGPSPVRPPLPIPRPSDDIAVIGRQWDTAVAKEWPGHEVLDLPDWTIAKNDQWVDSVVGRQMRVYIGSPESKQNLWDAVNSRSTVFGRELGQFMDAGYRRSGDYLLPPGR